MGPLGLYSAGQSATRPPTVGLHLVVYMFWDNDAVVDTFKKERPSDHKLQELLSEYIYDVCTQVFTPKFRKIGTKYNVVVDFESRRYDPSATEAFITSHGHLHRTLVDILDYLFNLKPILMELCVAFLIL